MADKNKLSKRYQPNMGNFGYKPSILTDGHQPKPTAITPTPPKASSIIKPAKK